MKQMLTLLICFGAAVSGMAQTGSEKSRDVILGKPSGGSSARTNKDVTRGRDNGRVYDRQGNRTNYPSGTDERNVDAVNREYDAKVQSIRNNPQLSDAEKERAIRQLNNDRARRIKAINSASGRKDGRQRDDRDRDDRDRDDDNRDDDDDYKKDKKDKKVKSNNGNHYGWEKGKGNQRKGGSKSGKKS